MEQQTVKSMTNEQLIGACVWLDREQKKSRAMMNSYKAELQARGLAIMEDHNVKYVKFYGDEGSAAITDSMSLDILNPDKLKELVGEGVYKMKVKEETKTTYKFDSKFEKAMKAIFTGDYTFETTLEEFLDEMSIKPDDKQKKLLLKKLKGEFEKDKETLISVLVPEGETVPDFDVELWYIYRIKNGELIKAFLPEEMIDAIIEGIRKSIFVETKGYKNFYKYVIPKIVVNYADEGATTCTDVLTNIVLSKRSFKAAQGDKSMKVDLDGIAMGGIKINGLDA